MLFKVDCQRCGTRLIKGEIFNYSGKKLCEDCYVLLYLFGQKAPDTFSPCTAAPIIN